MISFAGYTAVVVENKGKGMITVQYIEDESEEEAVAKGGTGLYGRKAVAWINTFPSIVLLFLLNGGLGTI